MEGDQTKQLVFQNDRQSPIDESENNERHQWIESQTLTLKKKQISFQNDQKANMQMMTDNLQFDMKRKSSQIFQIQSMKEINSSKNYNINPQREDYGAEYEYMDHERQYSRGAIKQQQEGMASMDCYELQEDIFLAKRSPSKSQIDVQSKQQRLLQDKKTQRINQQQKQSTNVNGLFAKTNVKGSKRGSVKSRDAREYIRSGRDDSEQEALQNVIYQIISDDHQEQLNRQSKLQRKYQSNSLNQKAFVVNNGFQNQKQHYSGAQPPINIPRYQKEILMKELIKDKQLNRVPRREFLAEQLSHSKHVINQNQGTHLKKQSTLDNDKQSKNVIVRRIKSGGSGVQYKPSADNNQNELQNNVSSQCTQSSFQVPNGPQSKIGVKTSHAGNLNIQEQKCQNLNEMNKEEREKALITQEMREIQNRVKVLDTKQASLARKLEAFEDDFVLQMENGEQRLLTGQEIIGLNELVGLREQQRIMTAMEQAEVQELNGNNNIDEEDEEPPEPTLAEALGIKEEDFNLKNPHNRVTRNRIKQLLDLSDFDGSIEDNVSHSQLSQHRNNEKIGNTANIMKSEAGESGKHFMQSSYVNLNNQKNIQKHQQNDTEIYQTSQSMNFNQSKMQKRKLQNPQMATTASYRQKTRMSNAISQEPQKNPNSFQFRDLERNKRRATDDKKNPKTQNEANKEQTPNTSINSVTALFSPVSNEKKGVTPGQQKPPVNQTQSQMSNNTKPLVLPKVTNKNMQRQVNPNKSERQTASKPFTTNKTSLVDLHKIPPSSMQQQLAQEKNQKQVLPSQDDSNLIDANRENSNQQNKLIHRTVGPFSGKMQSKPGAAELLSGLKNLSQSQARPSGSQQQNTTQYMDSKFKWLGGIQKDNKLGVDEEISDNKLKREPIEIIKQLPKTGIEQPFLATPPTHIRITNDLERLNSVSTNLRMQLQEDYAMRENSRVVNFAKSVYEVEKDSPHYNSHNEFIEPSQLVPQKSIFNGKVIEKKTTKNRYFHKLKPWYVPFSYSSKTTYSKSKYQAGGNSLADEDDVLQFESRFESGNLKRAIQLDKNEYELILKPDYGTKNYTQWFYFKLSNTRKSREYIFHIINFVKPESLFNSGMLPIMYSTKEAEQFNQGWYRNGYDVAYYQNNQPYCKIYGDSGDNKGNNTNQSKYTSTSLIMASNQKEPNQLFTLSFKFCLKHDKDEVYIAMCYPYTYTDCCNLLDRICTPIESPNYIRRSALCKTTAGNLLELLIITNFQSTQDQIARRKCIILTSRVHPGESGASFIIEGLLEFLVSNEVTAQTLRDRYVFKIVPMLNPDGVIVGNYRCSLSGHDLNRQYPNPSSKMFPECYGIKQMIRKTLECRKIEMYCDFHGHSRQKDLFMYGCSQVAGGGPQSDKRLKEQVFPMMFDRICSNFSFNGSSFVIHKSKESTGRVVMWKEFHINNSYTCEGSFCGPSQGIYNGFHFSIKMLLTMGKDFCKTLAVYSEADQTYYKQILAEVQYLHNDNNPNSQITKSNTISIAAQENLKNNKLQEKNKIVKGNANKSQQPKSLRPAGIFNNERKLTSQSHIHHLFDNVSDSQTDNLRGILSVTAKQNVRKK